MTIQETLCHFLFYCWHSNMLWKNVEQYYLTKPKEFHVLCLREVIIGKTKSKCPLLNYLRLIGKLYSWDCRNSGSSGQSHKCRLTWFVVTLFYTARICEFLIERLYSGLWSGHLASSVFLAIFGATVLQCTFPCILFLSIIFQSVRVVTFVEDVSHEQQLVHNAFPGYRVFSFF